MKHLRFAIVALIAQIMLFFGIDRFSAATTDGRALSAACYFVGFVAVLLLIAVPALAARPPIVSIAAALAVYAVARTEFFTAIPLQATEVLFALVEIGLLSTIVWSAHYVAARVFSFEQGVTDFVLADRDGAKASWLDERTDEIQSEIVRSRRYQRPLSVLIVKPNSEQSDLSLPQAVHEMQEMLIRRYLQNRSFQVLRNGLRRTDLVFRRKGRDELVVLSPETTADNSTHLMRRIQDIAARAGIAVDCGTASFPDSALTFEELVRQAEVQLRRHDLRDVSASRSPAGSERAITDREDTVVGTGQRSLPSGIVGPIPEDMLAFEDSMRQ